MNESADATLAFRDRFRACTHTQRIGEKDVVYTLMESKSGDDQPPVCFIPGLGISYKSYENSLETLLLNGRSFCAFGYVEAELPLPEMAQAWVDKKLAGTEHVQRALGLIEMVENVKDMRRPVTVIAHSVGAIHAVLAATLRPELFRQIVLYAPAGFIHGDSPLRIARESMNMGTIMRNQLKQLQAGPKGTHARDFLTRATGNWYTYLAQHLFNVRAEIRDVASTYIASLAHDLIQKGIPVSVELGEVDALFPPALLVPVLEKEDIPCEIHAGADHHSIGTERLIMENISRKLSE